MTNMTLTTDEAMIQSVRDTNELHARHEGLTIVQVDGRPLVRCACGVDLVPSASAVDTAEAKTPEPVMRRRVSVNDEKDGE